MRFYLWDDGNMPPFVYINDNEIKGTWEYEEWERHRVYRAYGNTKEEAEQKAINNFAMFIVENNLGNYCLIQWRNGNQMTIPCFGDTRGDWYSEISATFRRWEDMQMHTSRGRSGFVETKERI